MRRLLLALLACASLHAAVIHVDADASGANNGSSWTDACTTLQAGLALATGGDQVWISQGTYVPGAVRTATFTIPAGVEVYGGFLGTETALTQRQDDPGLVILSGEIGAAGYADNSNTIVTLAGAGRVDTLTITGANFIDTTPGNIWDMRGAGGLYATTGDAVSVIRCRFIHNRGHGPQVLQIRGVGSALVDRCEITDSSEITKESDSACNVEVGTVSFQNCGAVRLTRSVIIDSHPVVPPPTFTRGSAVFVDGSGYNALWIRNCIIANSDHQYGLSYGSISPSGDSGVQGCVFYGNRRTNCPSGSLRGSILEPTLLGDAEAPAIDERNWRTAVDGDPLFTDRANPVGADGIWFTADDGLRLQAGSPCIDYARFVTTTTTTGMPTDDILGNTRPKGHDPDCGAYEYGSGNTGPFALAAAITVNEDVATPVTLGGSDAEGDPLTAIITSLPGRGSLYATVDGLTPSGPALTAGQLPWAVPDPQRRVIYRPAADDSGTARATFDFQVRDAAITSYAVTVTIDVLAVNDAPTIAAVADRTITEDAGQQTIALSGISAGTPGLTAPHPGFESQVLTVSAESSNKLLIDNPTISYTSPATTAQLAFAPVANASGSALITVTVRDAGGTALGGVDTTTMTFTVTVDPINNPPRMDPIADLSIAEDAVGATLTVTGLSPGPADETGQSLTVSASSGDPALLRIASVDHVAGATTAVVHLDLLPEAHGSALVYVAAFDDGGTTGGGSNSTARVCLVTVTAVDDPPVLAANPGLTAASNHVTAIAAAQLRIADPDATPAGSLVFSIAGTPAHGAIRRAGTALPAGGTFTQADVDGGLITYANAGGISASDTWSFTWTDGTTPTQGPAAMAITLVGSELPVLAIPGAGAAWTEGASAVVVAASAVVSDPDAVPWDGGSVTATITAGAATGDLLGLAEQGVGLGQVSVLGASVRVGGTAVGTLSGGSGGVPLHIALSGAEASPASAQAIVRALTFTNQGGNPGATARSLAIVVNDGGAGASAPATVAVAVTPVNDPPAVATTWIGLPAGATVLAQLAADDPDGPAATWTLLSAPGLADVALEDASAGILRILAHPGAAGSGILRVRVDDGLAAAVEADIALVVSGGGDARPEPAGELPPDSHAGGEIDAILRFDTAGIGGSSGLLFSASADAPAGLQLTSVGTDQVRVRWSIPAATPAPAYVRFAIIASDPASRSAGILPVLLLVRPQPGGGG